MSTGIKNTLNFCNTCEDKPAPECVALERLQISTAQSDYIVGYQGQEYVVVIQILGGTMPYDFDVDNSTYPNGALFSIVGDVLTVRWTPTPDQADQVHEWDLVVTNCNGANSQSVGWTSKIYTGQIPLLKLTYFGGDDEPAEPQPIGTGEGMFYVHLDYVSDVSDSILDGFEIAPEIGTFDLNDLIVNGQGKFVVEPDIALPSGVEVEIPIVGTLVSGGNWYYVNFTVLYLPD